MYVLHNITMMHGVPSWGCASWHDERTRHQACSSNLGTLNCNKVALILQFKSNIFSFFPIKVYHRKEDRPVSVHIIFLIFRYLSVYLNLFNILLTYLILLSCLGLLDMVARVVKAILSSELFILSWLSSVTSNIGLLHLPSEFSNVFFWCWS